MSRPARPAPRDRPSHRCSECGLTLAKWVGQCPECQAWGSLNEVGAGRVAASALLPGPVTAAARPIAEIDVETARSRPTGVAEFDRVLGGGLVPGAVVLLAGEPGVGKSTLLLAAAGKAAGPNTPTLYVTGEESAAQVRLRAERTGDLDPHLWLAAETDLAAVLAHVDAVKPGLLIVDSVQTMSTTAVDGSAGGVTQIRAVTSTLAALAKERGIATVLVGHVTKDGSIAGPRLLEHLVDVVLYFEGDRHSTLRMIRAVKNRYGPADEVGCFALTEDGIEGITDPSGLFLSRRPDPVPGTCVTVTVEGRRPMLAEVQALVATSHLQNPRRAVSGLDAGRVAMILAVVERRGKVRIGPCDVYSATVGGIRVTEPATDLALALAVSSAVDGRALPTDVVALGELGLSGELRPVPDLGRRLTEAARLGFRRAIVPVGSTSTAGMELSLARDLGQAFVAVENLGRPRTVRKVDFSVV